MKKIYHLSTCSTCKRILSEIKASGVNLDAIELIDIKINPLQEKEVEELRELTDSYLSLFSKRAMKYKSLGLADKNLQEQDYNYYLLQDYTFLKRPVAVVNGQIFIGNSKSTVEAIIKELKRSEK